MDYMTALDIAGQLHAFPTERGGEKQGLKLRSTLVKLPLSSFLGSQL